MIDCGYTHRLLRYGIVGQIRTHTTEVLAEPDLRKYVQEQMSALAEVMIERTVPDKKSGHLPEEFEPQIVVPVVITYLQGIWRMALVSYNRKKYEKQIDLFLGGLGL